uniref:Uncharacterized protein n=1 Tax=Dunaliella tertiolecta TaxID=3047 RepID=A0A7S3QQV7_DUNTE
MAGLTSEQLAQVSELVGEQTLYLALPQVRGLIKQLSTCETWCQPSRDTDFNFKPPSPLDALPPQHGAELQGWVKVYLGQGHTAVDVKHAFQDLRQHCNEEQHMSAAEDVLQAILQLRQDISMPALKARDPFLHAAMAGAEDFSKCFLAEPRLFWLAYLVLDHCKHSLYHSYQDDCVWQDVPKLKKSARDAILTWTEMVTQNHERLGDGPSDFFASADSVSGVLYNKPAYNVPKGAHF